MLAEHGPTPNQDLNPPTPESQPKPKVLVTFFGFGHHQLNHQCLPRIRDALVRTFENSQGKNVIFLEDTSGTSSEIERRKKGIKKYGGLSNYFSIARALANEIGKEPTQDEVQKRREQIESLDIDSILEEKLLSRHQLQLYHLYKNVDQMRQKHSIEIDFESHSQPTLKVITEYVRRVSNMLPAAYDLWSENKFSACMEIVRTFLETHNELRGARDKEIIDYLKSVIRKLLKGEGGAIFILFGDAHAQMINAVQQKLGHNAAVKFEIIGAGDTDSPIQRIFSALKDGQEIPDTLSARYFLNILMGAILETECDEKSALTLLAHNFETVAADLETIAQGLSLDEIRRICEEHIDLLEVIRAHATSPITQQLLAVPA